MRIRFQSLDCYEYKTLYLIFFHYNFKWKHLAVHKCFWIEQKSQSYICHEKHLQHLQRLQSVLSHIGLFHRIDLQGQVVYGAFSFQQKGIIRVFIWGVLNKALQEINSVAFLGLLWKRLCFVSQITRLGKRVRLASGKFHFVCMTSTLAFL